MKWPRGFSLVEVVITISIFSGLGILFGVLTEQFVGTYLKSRDLSDLHRVSTNPFDELTRGDRLDFDGLQGAVELIEAGDRNLSFVPLYRDVSKALGGYQDSLLNTVLQDGGAPFDGGKTTGGLRVQFNSLANQYELRWYLAKHPRAGSGTPQAYLQSDDGRTSTYLPTRFVWNSPGNKDQYSRSYIVFTGGQSPLAFPGTQTVLPSRSVVEQIMSTNTAKLFPNPFSAPNGLLTVYYQPETEPTIIANQQSLVAHLIIKDSLFNPLSIKYEFASDSVSLAQANDLPEHTLFLYYDRRVKIFPSQTTLTNANFTNFRLQFPTQIDSETGLKPSAFSYYSVRSTSAPIQLESYNHGNRVPLELLPTVGIVRANLLMLIGATPDNIQLSSISRREFSQIIPLETLQYTQTISTKSSVIEPTQGFARENCLAGAKPDLRCRKITSNFPSGAQIRISRSFFIANLVWDTTFSQALRGTLALVVKSTVNQRVYKVLFDFESNFIRAFRKNNYVEEDFDYNPDVPDEKVVGFPIDNSQFLNFSNLQASGFVDEEFNYTHENIFSDHLGDSDANELYLEVNTLSNLEGFSLTYRPR